MIYIKTIIFNYICSTLRHIYLNFLLFRLTICLKIEILNTHHCLSKNWLDENLNFFHQSTIQHLVCTISKNQRLCLTWPYRPKADSMVLHTCNDDTTNMECIWSCSDLFTSFYTHTNSWWLFSWHKSGTGSRASWKDQETQELC